MEWARTTALAAASKPESFMLLDSFLFFFFFKKIKSEESSRIFSWVPWTGIKIFFPVAPLMRRADSRQCPSTDPAEWQWLNALLLSPHSHFPVCWWIAARRHHVGGMPEIALHSTVLMLPLGQGTLLMFLLKLCIAAHSLLFCFFYVITTLC